VDEAAKLIRLMQIEGYQTLTELFEDYAAGSACPAICCNPANPSCEYTTLMEPDQEAGYCQLCGTNTMKSAFVLAGMI
jgi:hypothetical protein